MQNKEFVSNTFRVCSRKKRAARRGKIALWGKIWHGREKKIMRHKKWY